MKLVVTSGYYDPVHIGHLRLFEEAKKLGDKLVVIVNNDNQAKLKKGRSFMPELERLELVKAFRCVDDAILSIDQDSTVSKTLELLKPSVFAKGGDSHWKNIPELKLCERLGIQIILDIGGEKIQSSSWLIQKLKSLAN